MSKKPFDPYLGGEYHALVSLVDFLLTVILGFMSAYVFMLGANWFAMPAIGRSSLGYWQAFGLLMVIRFAASGSRVVRKQDVPDAAESLKLTGVRYLIVAFLWLALFLVSRGI